MDQFILPPDTHIGHVQLRARDPDRMLEFYTVYLGLQEKERSGSRIVLSASSDHPGLISLNGDPQSIIKPPRTTGLYHIAIRFPSRQALGRTFQRLLEKRYPFQGAADHLVSEALYLADPEGNGLELYVDRPRQVWPRQGDQVVMGSEPLNLEDLLSAAAAEPAPSNEIDPRTDIGHIHLQVSDLGKAEAFYQGVLGLEVTQRSYPGALFLSAGGYHHHLGLNIWAGKGARRPPENATGLRSFQLIILDATARQTAIERCRTARAVVSGKNGAGQIVVQDPDGNMVEI